MGRLARILVPVLLLTASAGAGCIVPASHGEGAEETSTADAQHRPDPADDAPEGDAPADGSEGDAANASAQTQEESPGEENTTSAGSDESAGSEASCAPGEAGDGGVGGSGGQGGACETPEREPYYANVSHDHSQDAATTTFTIPEDALPVEVRVDFTPQESPTGWSCAGSMRVVVKRPDGSVFADATAAPGSGGTGSPDGAHCGVSYLTAPEGAPPAGEWTAEFTGNGLVTGWVRVRGV